MPRVSLPALPLSCIFAIAKPSGPTSMAIINDAKQLFARSKLFVDADKLQEIGEQGKIPKRGRRSKEIIKIGQGGTLDPLADGVLVVGIGKGTKKLGQFLDCVKEYRSTCLLGCETDTYDSEGSRVRAAPWRHVTEDMVRGALDQFRGEITQTPPIFSALKMDGKPLYEYARKGIPLPRPIEKRNVTVHSLELTEWKGSDHDFRWPEKQFTEEEKLAMQKALEGVEPNPSVKDEPELEASGKSEAPTAFVLSMTVSGGTYVRCIVHDLAHALGSAGHVVTLTRSRQGRFVLDPPEGEGKDELGCVPWEVLKQGLDDPGEKDEEGWTAWEREVMDKLEVVETPKNATLKNATS